MRKFPAVSGVFSLPTGTSQESPPVRSRSVFGSNPCVNGLVRNPSLSVAGKIAARTSGDLVGRPPLPQPFLYVMPRIGPVKFADSRLPASCFGFGLSRERRIAARAAVASQFTGDRAGIPFQPFGNLALFPTVVTHLGYDLAFFVGKMGCHRGDSVQKGKFPEEKPPYRTSPRCFHLYQFSTSLHFNFDAKPQEVERRACCPRRNIDANPQCDEQGGEESLHGCGKGSRVFVWIDCDGGTFDTPESPHDRYDLMLWSEASNRVTL
jgi:hypothetical protein